MRWYCWHDWSKWKTYRWHGIITPLLQGSSKPTEISRTQQARVCLKCGKEVHRRVYEADGIEYEKVQPVQQST